MQQKYYPGQTHQTRFKIDQDTIERFAEMSGDRNPIHLIPEEAKAYGYPKPVAHGAILVAFLSRMIGMEIPGPGAVWMNEAIEWLNPVYLDDEVELRLTVNRVSPGAKVLFLDVSATNQNGQIVMKGSAEVKMAEKLVPSPPPVDTSAKVALVTGGSGGLGAAIAQALGETGISVAVGYHASPQAAEEVARQIQSGGGSAQAFAGDLADAQATTELVHRVNRYYNHLDIVVHCASPELRSTPVGELEYSHIEGYLKVYLAGALALVRTALPGMVESKFGRFIFVGTSAMTSPPPSGWAAYLTAKHALWGLVRSLATELGPSGITCNMVSPGMTITDLTAHIPARAKEVEAQRSPMRRLAVPQDTAALVSLLASDNGGYINGANLPLTGGPL